MSLRRVSPAGRAWQPQWKSCMTVDMDRTVPWEYFLCPDFFLSLHQQRQRPVFLQLCLSPSRRLRLAPYSSIRPFPAGNKRNRARPTRRPVERRFLIKFSSIFMKILACRLPGHPVAFLAMLVFHGSLRGSKFTTGLARSSLQICALPAHNIELHLSAAKTDPFQRGVTVTVGASQGPCCPVTALARYLQATAGQQPTSPLFVFSSGLPLSRPAFTQQVQASTIQVTT